MIFEYMSIALILGWLPTVKGYSIFDKDVKLLVLLTRTLFQYPIANNKVANRI